MEKWPDFWNFFCDNPPTKMELFTEKMPSFRAAGSLHLQRHHATCQGRDWGRHVLETPLGAGRRIGKNGIKWRKSGIYPWTMVIYPWKMVIYPLNMGNYIWLVVYLPLWKMMEWKSVGARWHCDASGASKAAGGWWTCVKQQQSFWIFELPSGYLT